LFKIYKKNTSIPNLLFLPLYVIYHDIRAVRFIRDGTTISVFISTGKMEVKFRSTLSNILWQPKRLNTNKDISDSRLYFPATQHITEVGKTTHLQKHSRTQTKTRSRNSNGQVLLFRFFRRLFDYFPTADSTLCSSLPKLFWKGDAQKLGTEEEKTIMKEKTTLFLERISKNSASPSQKNKKQNLQKTPMKHIPQPAQLPMTHKLPPIPHVLIVSLFGKKLHVHQSPMTLPFHVPHI
jgi:hypothetical protein